MLQLFFLHSLSLLLHSELLNGWVLHHVEERELFIEIPQRLSHLLQVETQRIAGELGHRGAQRTLNGLEILTHLVHKGNGLDVRSVDKLFGVAPDKASDDTAAHLRVKRVLGEGEKRGERREQCQRILSAFFMQNKEAMESISVNDLKEKRESR